MDNTGWRMAIPIPSSPHQNLKERLMELSRKSLPAFIRSALLSFALTTLLPATAQAAENKAQELDGKRVASLLQAKDTLAPPPAGVADIKFREFFKMPIGPLGLEPTEKLLGLNGKRVRIFGYMVNAEEPSVGPFILAPLAVSMAEKEDGPADDMPATTIFVHIENGGGQIVPHVPGLLKLTGILGLGNREEPDGRVSAVRLQVDPDLSEKLLGGNQAGHAGRTSQSSPRQAAHRPSN
jgi:hypothetical protein